MSIVHSVPLRDCSRFLFGQISVAIGSMRPELIATSAQTPEAGGGVELPVSFSKTEATRA